MASGFIKFRTLLTLVVAAGLSAFLTEDESAIAVLAVVLKASEIVAVSHTVYLHLVEVIQHIIAHLHGISVRPFALTLQRCAAFDVKAQIQGCFRMCNSTGICMLCKSTFKIRME